ncbi:MAG: hypothetical protein HC804_06965 [Anaerolineae bacterium]|nr:hypothetical protein [Anaerolineae bacterium]
MLLVFAGYVGLTVAVARPLWDALPLLQTFQFPWRFLAPATLAAALLTGGLVSVNGNRLAVSGYRSDYRLRITDYGLPLLLIIILSAAHWGWLYPQQCTVPADTSLAGMVAWEQATQTLGTTASRELLPTAVNHVPEDTADLPPWSARLSSADLPQGATIHTAVYHPLRAQIELETAVPFTARFRTVFFPGWRVWVDGSPVPIIPSDPDGLITFAVPDGRHTIEVAFGETPLRWLADMLSLLSLALLIVILWRAPHHLWQRCEEAEEEVTADLCVPSCLLRSPSQIATHWLWALLVVGLLLLTVKWLLVDQGFTPLHHNGLAAGEWADLPVASGVTFGAPSNPTLVRLWGGQTWPTAVPADQPLPITLYWQALSALEKEYRVGLTLVDESGARWSSTDLRDDRWSRGAPPTTAWPPDQIAQTALLIDLLEGTPPGTYEVRLSLFDRESFMPLTVYEEGQPLGPYLSLGQIEVQPPKQPTAVSDTPLFASDEIAFYGSYLDRSGTAPGDIVWLSLFWSLKQEVGTAVTLSLLDEAGTVWQTWPVTLPAQGPGLWRSQLPSPCL